MTPLYDGPIPTDVSTLQAQILDVIRAATREHPASIDYLRVRLDLPRNTPEERIQSERRIMAAVRKLRNQHTRIGSKKGKPAGYFWIDSAEDVRAWERSYRGQILSELKTLRATIGPHAFLEFVGQEVMQMTEGETV